MRRIMLFLLASCLLVLGGCATNQYEAYLAAETARSNAYKEVETAKFQALSAIAASGNETAKVAAVISIVSSGQGGASKGGQGLQAPVSNSQIALQWASLLVPTITNGLVQGYTINRNTALGMKQSDNALATSLSQNQTMLGFGELIRSPVVVTQPDPVVVTQPAPVIVNPVVVETSTTNTTNNNAAP